MGELTTQKTVLVVDGVPAVLKFTVEILKEANFTVLEANDGATALELARTYAGKLDLLLSNVETRGMTGPALGAAMKAMRPDLRVMLMSGSSSGNLLVLNYGWAYIDKSHVSAKLREMVRDVIEQPDKAQSTYEYDVRKDTDPNKKAESGKFPNQPHGYLITFLLSVVAKVMRS